MTEAEFLNQWAELVEVEPSSLSLDTELGQIETWDSLSQVSFMIFADEHFGKILAPDQLDEAKKVADLWALVSA